MSPEKLKNVLHGDSKYKEIWLEGDSGQHICALINGDTGWLMYLRHEGDAGFSSRNPDVLPGKNVEFYLDNGQRDYYPESWTYPLHIIESALLSFIKNGNLPDELQWHDDSEDVL